MLRTIFMKFVFQAKSAEISLGGYLHCETLEEAKTCN